ncbi:MAG: acyl-CoA dehydrogenase family protein [Alphaproteobacteria bacterium]|nr:acyl-CoA dehydrogenase family protein [Alphaproteobacteria bacterium]
MDFALTDEQTAIFDMARGFAIERMAPNAEAWEEDGTLPRDVLNDLGELGMASIYVGEDYGTGLGRLDAALIFEALSYGCPSVAAYVSIHNMCGWMIDSFGSDDLKAKWLPKLASFETVASYCLTEPGSGSDAAALRTTAKKDNENYTLNGAKAFISGGGFSDLYVVMVRTGGEGPGGVSTVLVEKGTEGLSFGALEKKMGWKAQPTSQVQFDDCVIPLDNLLGVEGDGFKYAMKGLDGGRLNIAACSLGAAQAALDKALTYAGERKAFGKSIDQFQGIQFKLAEMEVKLQAARVFLRQAAWKLDNKTPDATKFCAMAKKFVTDACFEVANEALQIHGGYGYLADYGIEKIVRDLRVHQILEGTNEIMSVIISRSLLAARG